MEVEQKIEFMQNDDMILKVTTIESKFEDLGFIENNLIILTKPTLDKFLKENNPAELIALYTFYYYTAKWQNTNQAYCTDKYTQKGLKWGYDKFLKTKKKLIDFGLISQVIKRDEFGKITGYYIKMNYIFKEDTVSHYVQNPVLLNASTGQPSINALSAVKENALSAVKEKPLPLQEKSHLKKDMHFSLHLKAIIDYYNKLTNKKINYNSKLNAKYILKQLKAGWAVDDFKKVMDNKIKDKWFVEHGHFKPSTLFADSHFEDYLTETSIENVNKIDNVEEKYQGALREDWNMPNYKG
jgi:uncharacterized phage protein (TIGR02220 family)